MIDDHSPTLTVRTTIGKLSEQTFTDSLPCHLNKSEFGYVKHLGPRLVASERRAEGVDNASTIPLDLHIDEVDHDDAADISKSQLLGDFFGCLEVVGEHGLFEV